MATYVRPRENVSEFLAPALGHIGYVVRHDSRPVFDPKTLPPPIPVYLVRFIIEGQERIFSADTTCFTEIPASEVPKELRLALTKPELESEASLKLAEKTFKAADKDRQRALKKLQADVENIWESSRQFWRNWKGVNGKATGVPRTDQDPEGTDATNRPTPKIT